MWARFDGATLTITTNIGQHPPTPAAATTLDVPPWTHAFQLDTMVGFVHIVLAARSDGYVDIHTVGVNPDDAARIATGLTRGSATAAGWSLDCDNRQEWTPISGGWATGTTLNSVQWTDADGAAVAELLVATRAPTTVTTGQTPGANTTLVDISDYPALLTDNGHLGTVGWSPQPDVTVLIALRDSTPEQLAKLAESVQQVDQTTWDLASRPDASSGDGCNSLLC